MNQLTVGSSLTANPVYGETHELVFAGLAKRTVNGLWSSTQNVGFYVSTERQSCVFTTINTLSFNRRQFASVARRRGANVATRSSKLASNMNAQAGCSMDHSIQSRRAICAFRIGCESSNTNLSKGVGGKMRGRILTSNPSGSTSIRELTGQVLRST